VANLTQKTILLLDKLYNLKGEDNIILQEINSKIEGINNTITATNERRISLEGDKEANQNDLLIFTNQQEAFLTAFSGVSDDTFASLRNIGVDVNIASMVSAVSEKAPNYIRELQGKIESIQAEIDSDDNHKRELEHELEELNASRNKAIDDRKALVSLMEQSLSADETERESLPTKYVKDILNRFGIFEVEEVSTLTKLIMFPEDGLIEYDREYPERLAKGLVGEAEVITPEEETTPEEEITSLIDPDKREEVLAKTLEIVDPEETEEEEVVQPTEAPEEPVVEPTVPEETKPSREQAESIEIYDKRTEEEPTSIMDLTSLNGTDTPKEEEVEEPKEESIRDYLESLGLDMTKFQEENDKEENIDKLMSELSATDRELISGNYELLKSINAEIAAYRYRRNHSYLKDEELSKKITFLRSKKISEKSIKTLLEQAASGLRESLEVIENRFTAGEEMGTPITDEHIDLLGRDLVKLGRNIKLLSDSEINIDEKERRNYEYILTESEFIGADLEILKDYLINITRSNDKYAINVFAKDPYDLITDIDNIIENNLEDVLSTNPEVLTGRNGAFVDRVKYYERMGKPITDTTGRNAYAPYVLSPLEALKDSDGKLAILASPSEEEINPSLPSIIGNENTVSSIVDILNEYYKDRTDFKEIELSDTATEAYARLIEMFEQQFHAERVGQYTCKVADGYISKPKLERHLRAIVTSLEQNGESIDGIEKEVLLTAMLYNHRQDEQSLRRMVEKCLGFSEENTLGGRGLWCIWKI